ncbi:hypothetical protein [Cellulomonas fengjieae]|uniref:hypothetical protein n=1 Tax=Cellulomonas fengjieae TaxID=2819978 RepID=UPI001AAF0968|nr:hypothetical protein [Cellulomonas fengjieae]MBO3103970.1 hypothetical protein [Cellulomonas fengjieae]
MARTVQLRRYHLKPHLVDEFLAWWPALLVPARAEFGFTVESAYLDREAAEFTWAVSAEGSPEEFGRLEQAWMASPERAVVFEGVTGWNDSAEIALVERLV